ncbi:hypothetical protein F5B19DRAFT_490270 [Rostrohypoxylon terebratum]|nr:hypothetical protein F5B19DRAFT_490270 [Rostrohypoxylon terebratum]
MADVTGQQGSRPLKYTVTHYRKKEHTHEEFLKWIVEEHLPLALPVFKKHGIISYSLQMQKMRPTWDFAGFDCVLEHTLPDMQTIQKVMTDPDWALAVKDQENWVDTSKALLSLGYQVPYLLESGEIVNMPK